MERDFLGRHLSLSLGPRDLKGRLALGSLIHEGLDVLSLVARCGLGPGLHGERQVALLGVEADDAHIHLLPHLDELCSGLDAALGQLNLSLTNTQTAALAVGSYQWELIWVVGGGTRTALAGVLEVTA